MPCPDAFPQVRLFCHETPVLARHLQHLGGILPPLFRLLVRSLKFKVYRNRRDSFGRMQPAKLPYGITLPALLTIHSLHRWLVPSPRRTRGFSHRVWSRFNCQRTAADSAAARCDAILAAPLTTDRNSVARAGQLPPPRKADLFAPDTRGRQSRDPTARSIATNSRKRR